MAYLMAIDPGWTIGFATFDEVGSLVDLGQVTGFDEYLDWLNAQEPAAVIVYEDFTLFRKRALQQSGSNMITSQAIGATRAKAKEWGADIVKQPANILPVAEKFAGFTVKSKGAHTKTHGWSAYCHGIYYLVKSNRLTPRGIRHNHQTIQ